MVLTWMSCGFRETSAYTSLICSTPAKLRDVCSFNLSAWHFCCKTTAMSALTKSISSLIGGSDHWKMRCWSTQEKTHITCSTFTMLCAKPWLKGGSRATATATVNFNKSSKGQLRFVSVCTRNHWLKTQITIWLSVGTKPWTLCIRLDAWKHCWSGVTLFQG
jgi:hypothetical protein